MVSVNTKSGPMDQIGNITSMLLIMNGGNIKLDITYADTIPPIGCRTMP